MDEAIRYAKKYLEDLLSFFGLNTDVGATHEEDVIELTVPSTYLNGFLIGQRGDTLKSLQFLISSALKSQNFEYTRVNLDVADYKKHRQDRLAEQAEIWVEDVRASGRTMVLNPMNPADRRIVHKVVGEYSDLSSASEGEGRDRHIVIRKIEGEEESTKESAPSTKEEEKASEETSAAQPLGTGAAGTNEEDSAEKADKPVKKEKKAKKKAKSAAAKSD